MKIVIELFLHFIKVSSYRFTARRIKRKGLIIYLKTIQIARKSILGILVFAFVFQLMVLGLIGALITGSLLLPIEQETRLWILFGLFAFIFIVPAGIILTIMSEKAWFKASRAQELIDET